MQTLIDRLRNRQLESYAVLATDGVTWAVEATCVIERDGKLIFKAGLHTVAIAAEGTWQRVIEGITLEDIEKGTIGKE